MHPDRHAKSPSPDRLGAHGSKTDGRSKARAAELPAPATTGPENPSSCRCDLSPATLSRRSVSGSSAIALRAATGMSPLQNVEHALKRRPVNIVADDHPPRSAENNHHLSRTRGVRGCIARWRAPLVLPRLTTFRLIGRDHHRHKSSNRARCPLAVCLAPGEQQRIRYPVPARCRRYQPRSRKTLLNDPQLLFVRPPTPSACIDNFKPRDATTVSKDIHTDSQLQAAQPRKAALTECLRFNPQQRCTGADSRLPAWFPQSAS